MIGTLALVTGIWSFVGLESGNAADKKKILAELEKIADLLEKGNDAGAKKAADAFAKGKDFDMAEVMAIFKLRTKGGIGVGPKAGDIKPDGIEALAMNLEKAQKKLVDTYPGELSRMSYLAAAVALSITDKCPVAKKMGNKNPADWKQWSEDMQKSAIELAAAAKDKKVNEVKTAAKKLNNSCVSCHSPFRQD